MCKHHRVKSGYYLLLIAIFSLPAGLGHAQNLGNVSTSTSYTPIYRPSNIDWYQISTPHFNIIYPAGYDSLARRSASILEQEYPEAQQLVGGTLSNLPVILNTYNASGNGYVTPVNFRMEIYTNPIIGKSQNPMNSGWLENVLSHELIHANHFNQEFDTSLLGLISLFSPDAARGTMGLMAPGIFEGLAVEHESHGVEPLAGRGNYAYFTGRYQTIFQSPERMSLGQMMHRPLDTRPLNRYYMGGYEFVHWLHESYGEDISTEAFGFYMNWPFLGYGSALRHATGEWPWHLYDEYEESAASQYRKHNNQKEAADSSRQWTVLDTPFEGEQIRRPSWIEHSTLLFHGSFYDKPSGFYQWDTGNSAPQLITTYQPVEDYQYGLSADKSSLVIAAYDAHPIYDEFNQSGVIEINLTANSTQTILKDQNQAFYAPFYNPGGNIEVLNQIPGGTEWLKSSNPTGKKATILHQFDTREIISVSPNPADPNTYAVIVNERGRQGLYVLSCSNIDSIKKREPDIWFSKGSIFDASWHPDGTRILFTGERDGRMQLYEYHRSKRTLVKFNSPYINTYEPALSPDQSHLAAVAQIGTEEKLVKADYPSLTQTADTLSANQWNSYKSEYRNPEFASYQLPDGYKQQWNPKPYSPGAGWLKPRTLQPGTSMRGDGYGMSFLSINELRSQAYNLEFKYYSDRFWYHASYTNKTFYPGFNVSITDEPEDVVINTGNPAIGNIKYVRQHRSYEASIPFNYRFSSNPTSTSLSLSSSLEYEQFRPQEGEFGDDIPFFNRTMANFSGVLNYKLDQKLRDVQPYTGSYLYFSTDHDLNTSGQKSFLTNRIISGRWIEFPVGYTQKRHAYLAGAGGYISLPALEKLNQSLRIQGAYLWQNTGLSREDYSIYSEHFSDQSYFLNPNNRRENKNLLSLDTRYTIPLLYPDKQGFFVPAGVYNIYAVLFSDTIFNLNKSSVSEIFEARRSVLGIGLRTQFRLSIATFDIGVGISYDFWSDSSDYFVGSF